MATSGELRCLLEATSVPVPLIEEFLDETNALWSIAEPAGVVAGEVVLCHPPLDTGEVRAVVMATDQAGLWRITVVTYDRPGLLAATAGVLAADGLAVTQAAVTVLPTSRLALQRITVQEAGAGLGTVWEDLSGRLRAVLGGGAHPPMSWTPSQPVTVSCHPQGVGRVLLQVTAPDRTGLLWAIATAISEGGANIEAARLGTDDGMASDVFIVKGPVDATEVARRLSETEVVESQTSLGRILSSPLTVSSEGLRKGADLLGRLRAR